MNTQPFKFFEKEDGDFICFYRPGDEMIYVGSKEGDGIVAACGFPASMEVERDGFLSEVSIPVPATQKLINHEDFVKQYVHKMTDKRRETIAFILHVQYEAHLEGNTNYIQCLADIGEAISPHWTVVEELRRTRVESLK